MVELKDMSPIRYCVVPLEKGIYAVLDLAEASREQWVRFKKHIPKVETNETLY